MIAAARAGGVERIIGQSLAYAYDPAAEAICDEDQPLWRHGRPDPQGKLPIVGDGGAIISFTHARMVTRTSQLREGLRIELARRAHAA